MRYTIKLVEQENWKRRIFNEPLLDANNLSATDIQRLIDSAEASLSPENLTMDGELPTSKVKQRKNMFEGAIKELRARQAA